MSSQDRTRARRRWQIAALVVLLAGAGMFAALPWVLGCTFARRLLTARANAILAPSSVEVAAIRLSWLRPTEIVDVVLRDQQGDRLLVAPRAIFQWSLWQILFHRPATATLTVHQGDLDIERLADGTVDLYETLEPIIEEHPRRQLIIQVEHGSLRFRDPALPEPVVADEAEILLDLPVDPGPIEWTIALARTAGERGLGRIELKGSYDRSVPDAAARGDARISVKAARWPWALAASGIAARGNLDGTIEAQRRSARWVVSGDAALTDLTATSARLPARAIRLDTIRAGGKVEGRDDLWTAQRLEFSTPMGSIAGGGSSPSSERRGDWLDGDIRLALQARYAPQSDRLEISDLAMTTPYARLDGSGTIQTVMTAPQVDLSGSIDPDWPALESRLVREVEPNARIAGRPHPWRLAGTIAKPAGEEGDGLAGLRGELGIQLDALDVFGMCLGETAVVLRAEGGQLSFQPIHARLNQGILHLEPHWVLDGDGHTRLKFDSASTLEDVVVNDEVSHRILSYAAPVLDGATRVQGRVSVKGLDAEFPLFAADAAPARIEGDVLFDDVQFLPGPLADSLVNLLPQPERTPRLVLRDPIAFRITGRKVYQSGLVIPLGKVAAVGLEGSVDFEKNLDLVARFTANPPRSDRPFLSSVLRTARFELPIRGTLKDPQIDVQSMKERLKSLGSDLLETSVAAGADGFLRLLEGLPARREARKPPSAPDETAPPARPRPPTPEERQRLREERRLERLEKKAERRLRRGQPPD
jgi:hypothetical protein